MGSALKILEMKHLFRVALIAGAYIVGLFFWSVVYASSSIVYEQPPEIQEVKDEEIIILIATSTPQEFVRAEVSAYTSSVEETDDTPEINAMGRKPGPGSIACPARYEFGTRVIVAGKNYFCDDRMSPRYSGGDYFDIWMSSRDKAVHWGRRHVTVEVVQ